MNKYEMINFCKSINLDVTMSQIFVDSTGTVSVSGLTKQQSDYLGKALHEHFNKTYPTYSNNLVLTDDNVPLANWEMFHHNERKRIKSMH